MAKFHHKLAILNKFLYKDFSFARREQSDSRNEITIATAILGESIGNSTKANKMQKLLAKVKDFYNSHNINDYNLKVAIFVSKHKVLSKPDFIKLNQSLNKLPKIFKKVKSNLSEYNYRHKFLGIF